MNVAILNIMLGLGTIGHGLNMYCDRRLSIFPNGQIDYTNFKDLFIGDTAAKLMEGISEKVPMFASVAGVFAIILEMLGYASLGFYIYAHNKVPGMIALFCVAVYGAVGSAYHAKEGFAEFLFIKMGRDDRAKEALIALHQAAPILRVCSFGLIEIIIVYSIAVISGSIRFPLWSLLFTVLPVVIVIFPFKIIGSLHIGAMVSMLGWLLLMK